MPSILVKDFGPIANAEVELKPLTVLIGSNNTGKSYLALAAYSLSRAIAGTSPRYGPLLTRRPFRHVQLDRSAIRRLSRAIGDSRHQIPTFDKLLSEGAEFNEFPPKVQQWMRNDSKSWATDLSTDVSYELRRCFGSSLDQLGRRVHEAEHGQFSIELRDESTGFCWKFRCHEDELTTEKWESSPSTSPRKLRFPWISSPLILSDTDDELLGHVLMMSYSEFLLSGYSSLSHYLPASRTGILQGHKTLASLIVDRASSAWIESMEVERLPGVITDLIRALLRLQSDRRPSPRVSKIVQFLETSIVDGTVDVEKQLEYPDINYTTQAGAFQLHQVSSTVSEIAPLVLFLKYLVRPGQLFIIEEPESHLDPANQSRLAKAIAMMVNAGIRVLVTTHSDIFLNQINNLMQAFHLPARKRLRMGYYATEVLDSSNVAAYVFHQDPKGTEVSSLPIEFETGISTASSDEVHRALYDESIKMERMG